MSVLYWHRPDRGVCGRVVLVERQDWAAPVGFSSGKEDVLVSPAPVIYQKSRQTSLLPCSVAVGLCGLVSHVWMDTHNHFPDFCPTSFQMQPALL